MGGPVNPVNGLVLRAGGMPDWAGVDIRAMFGPIFPGVPILRQRSNCAAIAEMTWGAPRAMRISSSIRSTSASAAPSSSGGRVLRGIAGGAGEFGHVVIDPNGPPCRCGNHGCLEVYASAREPLAEAERAFRPPAADHRCGEQGALAGDECPAP